MTRIAKGTLLSLALLATHAFAQPGVLTKELLLRYTPDWKKVGS